jgi:Fe-S-cluster containining protein
MLTRKEMAWLACDEKSCCHNSIVIPTGRDVWRIARALDAPMRSFLMYFPAAGPRRDAFVLDRSGASFRIALGKGAGRRRPPPCIFLLRTRSGQHRCGLGDLRPLVCRAFPADLEGGVLALANDGRCTCRTWTLTDVDIAEETALVEARQRDAEEYCALVAGWNASVASAPTEATFSFEDYCAYMLESYDIIADGGAASAGRPTEGTLAR